MSDSRRSVKRIDTLMGSISIERGIGKSAGQHKDI